MCACVFGCECTSVCNRCMSCACGCSVATVPAQTEDALTATCRCQQSRPHTAHQTHTAPCATSWWQPGPRASHASARSTAKRCCTEPLPRPTDTRVARVHHTPAIVDSNAHANHTLVDHPHAATILESEQRQTLSQRSGMQAGALALTPVRRSLPVICPERAHAAARCTLAASCR